MKRNLTKSPQKRFFFLFLVFLVVSTSAYSQQKTFESTLHNSSLSEPAHGLLMELDKAEKALLKNPETIKNHDHFILIRQKVVESNGSQPVLIKTKDDPNEDKEAGDAKPVATGTPEKDEKPSSGVESDADILLSQVKYYFNPETEQYLEVEKVAIDNIAKGEYIKYYYHKVADWEYNKYKIEHIKENPDADLPHLFYKKQEPFGDHWVVTELKKGFIETEAGYAYMEEEHRRYTFDSEGKPYVYAEIITKKDDRGRILKSHHATYDAHGELTYKSEFHMAYNEKGLIKEIADYIFSSSNPGQDMKWSGKKRVFHYNEQGKKTEELTYTLTNDKELKFDTKEVTSYNEFDLADEVIIYHYSGEEWVKNWKKGFHYEDEKVVEVIHYLFEEGIAIPANKTTYQRNENNDITEEVSHMFKRESEEWFATHKTIYHYDESNQLVEKVFQYRETIEGGYVSSRRELYIYDGGLITTIYQWKDAGEWTSSYKVTVGEKILDNNVRSAQVIEKRFDQELNDWVLTVKDIVNTDELNRIVKSYSYSNWNGNGKEVVKKYEYHGTTSKPTFSSSYEYYKQGEEEHMWGGKRIYEYEEGKVITEKNYVLLPGSSYPDNLQYHLMLSGEYSYNEKGNIEEIHYLKINMEGVEGKFKVVFNYAAYGELCDFTVTGDTIIVDSKVVLTAEAASEKTHFIWKDSDGKVISDQASVEITKGGLYTVRIANYNICAIKTIKVYDVCELEIVGPENNVIIESESTLTAVFEAEEVTYKWTDGEDNVLGTKKELTINAPGTYTLEVISGFCYAHTSVEIKSFVTSSRNLEKTNINLYPNPVNSNLNIQNLEGETTINIYSVDGRMVYKGKSAPGLSTFTIDLSKERTGLYILELRSDKKIEKFKFIRAN